MAEHEVKQRFLLLTIQSQSGAVGDLSKHHAFVPSNLAQIYSFDQMIREISRKNVGIFLIFCVGMDRSIQMKTTFLIGAHLILTHNFGVEEIVSSFQTLNDDFGGSLTLGGGSLSIWSCWCSLASAQKMDWLDFWAVFEAQDDRDGSIKLDEYVHYAR